MKIEWIKGLVGCCLFCILSKGYAGKEWVPEEDSIIVEFVQNTEVYPILSWPCCANVVNAYRMELGLLSRRTAEACRKRWDRLKEFYPDVAESCKCRPLIRHNWTEDEDRIFLETVEKHRSDAGIDWKGIEWEIGGNMSAQQYRSHYKTLVRKGILREETLEGPNQQPNDEEFFE
jgi:hypothetical protein